MRYVGFDVWQPAAAHEMIAAAHQIACGAHERGRGHVAFHYDTSGLIENAHVHAACVQIDTTVIWMLLGI